MRKFYSLLIFFILGMIFYITAGFFYHCYKKEIVFKPFPSISVKSVPKILEPIYSNSIFVMESKTKTILFEKNPDILIPPASLTKLVSLYLVYEKIEQGILKKTDIIPVSVNAWAKMLPTDATRMFLEPGQRPSLLDIMLGVALPSGNDASIALAELIDGNVNNFVLHMNKKVKELGFKHLHFEDPNGLSNSNYITAREFTEFSNLYITRYPEAITDLHSVKTFVYPRKENFAPFYWGRRRSNLLPNHNPLLGYLEGVDGLKTGFISKSGLNIALTAKRDNMRVVATILGSFGKRGNSNRMKDATKIINYIYDTYRLEEDLFKQNITLGSFFKPLVSITHSIDSMVVLKDSSFTTKPFLIYYNPFLIRQGDTIGYLLIKDEMNRQAHVPLVANKLSTPIPIYNLWKHFLDIIYRLFTLWVK